MSENNNKINLYKNRGYNFIEKNKNLHEVSLEYYDFSNQKTLKKSVKNNQIINLNNLNKLNLNFIELEDILKDKNKIKIKNKKNKEISNKSKYISNKKYKTIKLNKKNDKIKPRLFNCFLKKKDNSLYNNNIKYKNKSSNTLKAYNSNKKSIFSKNSNNSNYSKSYYKNVDWLMNKNKKIEDLKNLKKEKELENCSFTPNIKKNSLKLKKEKSSNLRLLKNSKVYNLVNGNNNNINKLFFNKLKETKSNFNSNNNYKKIYSKILNNN